MRSPIRLVPSPLATVLGLLAASLAASVDPATAGTFEDPRDGRTYRTVTIGGHDWLAENLAFATPASFCPEGREELCASHGRLYRWEDAMRACPPGTHLSSEYEWQALERALGLPEVEIEQRRNRGSVEGARLKVGGDTGFDTVYAGWRRYEDGSYRPVDGAAAFWTSAETDLAHAQHRDIDVGDDMIWRSPVVKHYALSVRCVVDRYDADEYAGDDTHPAFSPDGTMLAYISNRAGVAVDRPINFEIYVLDLATKRERRLTRNEDFEADLAWSPDGSRIAFKSHRDGNDEVYLMNADGSNQVNLTRSPASDGGPSFTPDGDRLVFFSDRHGGEGRDLYSMDLDGGDVRRLTHGPGNNNSPAVSPDGSRVAFVSNRDGNDEVYVMPLAGGDARRVTDAPLADWSPRWTPDGNALLVTHGDWDTDEWTLDLVPLDGGPRRTIHTGNDSGNGAWRVGDGTLAFGGATAGDEGEPPGPARIHFLLPGGARPQPVTGRLAGTFESRP